MFLTGSLLRGWGGNEVAQMFTLGSKGNTVLDVHELAEVKAPD